MSVLANAPVSPIVPATDLQRARDFYVNTLGLTVAYENEGIFMAQAGNETFIAVYLRPGGQPAEHTAAGWQVEDLDVAIDQLTDRGVVFEHYDMPDLQTDERGIVEMDSGRSAWFQDSEGNILAINEM